MSSTDKPLPRGVSWKCIAATTRHVWAVILINLMTPPASSSTKRLDAQHWWSTATYTWRTSQLWQQLSSNSMRTYQGHHNSLTPPDLEQDNPQKWQDRRRISKASTSPIHIKYIFTYPHTSLIQCAISSSRKKPPTSAKSSGAGVLVKWVRGPLLIWFWWRSGVWGNDQK